MSFLEKQEEKGSSFWDWVIGIGLILLVGGFAFYYQYEKRVSRQGFQKADSLYQAGDYKSAASKYEELKEAQYMSPQDDSLLYARLDHIKDFQEQDGNAVRQLATSLSTGDTLAARRILANHKFKGLLSPQEQGRLDSLRRLLTNHSG